MRSQAGLRRWLSEPLLHFLAIGALVFVLNGLRDRPVEASERTIVVAVKDVERLALAWERTWRRPPTPSELDGLIRDHIKEEVYYREALRLGLDEDDPMVRRRMRMKMEAIAGAAAEAELPDDADLEAMLQRDPERYAPDATMSFEQVLIGAGDDADAMLRRLQAGERVEGAPTLLPSRMRAARQSDITRAFGEEFGDALAALPVGAWSGPVQSGFGMHLVRIGERNAVRPPTLDEARKRLQNDWLNETRQEREAAAYQALLDGYEIRIEQP